MVSHPELGSDPPIGPDRDSGCDRFHSKEVIDYIETFSPISTKKLILGNHDTCSSLGFGATPNGSKADFSQWRNK